MGILGKAFDAVGNVVESVGTIAKSAGNAVEGFLSDKTRLYTREKALNELETEFAKETAEYQKEKIRLEQKIKKGGLFGPDLASGRKLAELEGKYNVKKAEYESKKKNILSQKTKKEIELEEKEREHNRKLEEIKFQHEIEMEKMEKGSANLDVYKIEKQAEVGVAVAEALRQMGENGAGNMNSGKSSGFNPAAMMASMAVGGAVGQNIAGTMNGIMNSGQQGAAVPPPISTSAYHVAVNGQSTGPFDASIVRQMAAAGQISGETLVWKQGMASWTRADSVDELKGMFPPPLV